MKDRPKVDKKALLQRINQRIEELQEAVREIEDSSIPDLQPITELHEVVRQRRQALGISPSEAAELTGISPNTWMALERERTNPRLNTLIEAGRTLNLNIWLEGS